jgi:hypothetical protein
MADYYPLIAKAVAGLDKSTGETRRALYDRARTALLAQLRGVEPALTEPEITRERLALEEAIRKVEGEIAFQRTPEAARRPRAEATTELPQEFAEFPPGHGGRATRPAIAADDGDDLADAEETRQAALLSTAANARAPEGEARRTERWSPGGPSLSGNGLRGFRDSTGETGPADEGAVRTYPAPDRDFRRSEQSPGQWTEHDNGDMDQGQILHDQDFHSHDFQGRNLEHAPPLPRPSSRDAPPRPPKPLVDQDDGHGRAPQSFPRIARPERAQTPERVAPERPRASAWSAPRNTNRIVAIGVIALLALGIIGVAYWLGEDIISSLHGTSSRTTDQTAPADATRGKIVEHAPSLGAGDSMTPQKVVLYEEDPSNPNGIQFVGTAMWRTERDPPAPGQKPEVAIRGDIEIPEQKITVRVWLRRNVDKQLPVSHTVEINFSLPPDFPHGGIASIPGIMVKQGETNRGIALNGQAVKVMDNYFLVGLYLSDADVQRNVQLLKERSWFDIPVVYADGKRALVAIEKGPPGERAFAEAFAAWDQP